MAEMKHSFCSEVCTTKQAGISNVHHYQVRVSTDESGQISLNHHGKLGCFSNRVIAAVRNDLLLVAWSIWFCIPSCRRQFCTSSIGPVNIQQL